MKRYLYAHIIKDLSKKMVFVTGPRQVGKTFLSKQLMGEFTSPVYLNFDDIDDAQIIRKREWKREADLIILDEVHKMREWKQFLKGTFDTKEEHQTFLVTGSARLETFRQTGESLAGRYFHYRLYPLSVSEIGDSVDPHASLIRLMNRGGFPEPYLGISDDDAVRWRRLYYSDLIREDIMDFSRINEIRTMQMLLELLRKKVGSPLSYSSLSEDLQIAPNTVKKYIAILESLYIIFLLRPFHKNIARAIVKEPKIYFYDTGYVKGDEGVRFENMVALSLLKQVHYLQDVFGKERELNYFKTKEGKEVDFIVSDEHGMRQAIEVKTKNTTIAKQMHYFKKKFPAVECLQLVLHTQKERESEGIKIVPAAEWLNICDV